ncbi:ATP-binding protein [Alicyclobacillus sp.]|uniref:two-component system sensor histidine kinase NtrB n=1 Tax=Alicyclobacillus sp. TaxID=61169 RepID=UPI0025B97C4A|nr:ATP-binding protein [Alicyclobacillus sp.]MCL6516599.1 two-component sensor histidine kinase [Alicyclobacillus sp.]
MAVRWEADPGVAMDGWNVVGRMNCGLIYVDKRGTLTVFNELAAQLLDIDAPLGQAVPLSTAFPDDGDEPQLLSGLITSGRELKNQVLTWTRGDRIRHVLADSFNRFDPFGVYTGFYMMMKDLGDLRTLEQHVQRTEKMATLEKIAAGLAHELRNPLTTVKGFLQMMERKFSTTGQERDAKNTQLMLREIGQVEALMDELMLLSRVHKVQPRACTMEAVLDALEPELSGQAEAAGMTVRRLIDPLPPFLADPGLLTQAIRHLAENAIEAMEPGGVLTLAARRSGDWLEIDVSDTGPGIPYYLMDRIFDVFFTTKDRGTGLGLAICQRIALDHGGEIRVSSKGFGTTFRFLMPFRGLPGGADCPRSSPVIL